MPWPKYTMTFAPFTASSTFGHVAFGEYTLTTVAPAAAAAVATRFADERYESVTVPEGPTMMTTFSPAAWTGAGAGTVARNRATKMLMAREITRLRTGNRNS